MGALRRPRNYGLRSRDSPQVPPHARRGSPSRKSVLGGCCAQSGRRQWLGLAARCDGRPRASFEGAIPTMLVLKRLAVVAVTVLAIVASEGAALAGLGQPSPWELGLQQSASPVMENIVWFHDFLLWVVSAIVLFVLALLLIVIVRFNARANPVPSRTTHKTSIEVLWTVIPIF